MACASDVEAVREAHRRGQTALVNEGALSPKQDLRNADRDFDAALDRLVAALEAAERKQNEARIAQDTFADVARHWKARAEAAEAELEAAREVLRQIAAMGIGAPKAVGHARAFLARPEVRE